MENAGADVIVAEEPDAVADTGLIVNRVSSGLMGKMPQRALAFQDAFAKWARAGRTIINGADCYRIGHSKLAQASLFKRCGVRTPQTRAAIPGGRALPGIPVLLKPTAGGFGKGIFELGPNEDAPDSSFTSTDGWVEQARIIAVDGRVHRIEILGARIL
ncbi:MAG: ATP-grasp domain-containing protein, partial [Luteolibacter sp.]